MSNKKKTLLAIIAIVFVLSLRWYVAYRYMPSDSTIEELLNVISMSSGFTNIIYMLSIYNLFYLFIAAMRLPLNNELYVIRYSRKAYLKKGLKSIVSSALLFSALLAVMQLLFITVQFQEVFSLFDNGYLLGMILNIIIWTLTYAIFGAIFYFSYLCSGSKLVGIGIAFGLSMLLLAEFRYHRSRVLFSELDIFQLIWSNRLNLIMYFMVCAKYVALIWLIYVVGETVARRKDYGLTRDRRMQNE